MKETKFFKYFKKGKIQLPQLCKYNESFKKTFFGFSYHSIEILKKKRSVFFFFDPINNFDKNDTLEKKLQIIKTWNEDTFEEPKIISKCEICHKEGSFYNRDEIFPPPFLNKTLTFLECCSICKKVICGLDHLDVFGSYKTFSTLDILNYNNDTPFCGRSCLCCKKFFCKNCIINIYHSNYLCKKCIKKKNKNKKY